MSSLGKRIKEYRLNAGYKIAEFASVIGISQGSLSDIENEKTKPSSGTLETLVRNTDIDAVWLLTGGDRANYIKKKDTDTEPSTIEERKYVKKLLRILRSNDALMRNAIIPNLDAFDGRLITGEHTEKKRRAGNDG